MCYYLSEEIGYTWKQRLGFRFWCFESFSSKTNRTKKQKKQKQMASVRHSLVSAVIYSASITLHVYEVKASVL